MLARIRGIHAARGAARLTSPASHQEAHDSIDASLSPRPGRPDATPALGIHVEPHQALLGLRGMEGRVGIARHDRRDQSHARMDQRTDQLVERVVLQRAAIEGRARLPEPADHVRRARVRVHHPRGVRPLSAADARVPLAAVAHDALPERMARRPQLLPDRARPARRQPRPADRGRLAVARVDDAVAVARPAVDGRHADLVRDDPLVDRRRGDDLARRPRDHDSRLHGVGRDDLCDRGLVRDAPLRPSARVDQLPAAARRGGLPLQPDPHPRERRADRVLQRRARRDRARAGPVPAHPRKLVARDALHEAAHVRAELLRAAREPLSDRGRPRRATSRARSRSAC
ncbi:ABC transporter, permease/ATP-binding domain protein [Burkholderia pseudomallei MSHR684]|nr:ABC transporter, permease/ATP-binding domain protein [Burkholderia pseudomallei MSHR684]